MPDTSSGPLRLTPFEPIRVYDSPWVVVSNLIDGEFTRRGSLNALMDPSRLSPSERTTLEARLKAAAGGNPLSDALIGLATNPFVWLGMAFMPGAKGALLHGTGGSPGRVWTGHMRGTPVANWFGHATEALHGTPAAVSALEELDIANGLRKSWEDRISPHVERLTKHLGLKEGSSLVHLARSKDPRHRLVYESLRASLAGDDRDVKFTGRLLMPEYRIRRGPGEAEVITDKDMLRVLELDRRRRASRNLPTDGLQVRPTADGGWAVNTVDEPRYPGKAVPDQKWQPLPVEVGEKFNWVEFNEFRPRKLNEDLEPLLRSEGAWELREAIRTAMHERFLHQVAKDSEIKGLLGGRAITSDDIDPEKVKRLWGTRFGGLSPHTDPEEMDLASALFSSDMREALQARKEWIFERQANKKGSKQWRLSDEKSADALFSYKEWENLLTDSVVAKLQGFDSYMPRNVLGHYTLKNGNMTALSGHEMRKYTPQTGPRISGRTHERVDADPAWGLQSMDRFEDTFGPLGMLAQGEYGWYNFRRKAEEGARAFLEGGRVTKEGSWQPQRAADAPVPMLENDLIMQLDRYQRSTAEDVLKSTPIPEGSGIHAEQTRLIQQGLKHGYPYVAHHRIEGPITDAPEEAMIPLVGEFRNMKAPEGGWTYGHVHAQSMAMMEAVPKHLQPSIKYRQGVYQDVVLPYIFGTYDPGRNTRMWIAHHSQHMAETLANGPMGKLFEKLGGGGMMQRLREFSTQNPEHVAATMARANSRTAGYLYGTTLGWNMSSVMLQFLQPYVGLAGQVGLLETMRAQVKASREVGNYVKGYWGKRSQLGRAPNAAEIRDLKTEHFEFPEETGLFGHVLEDLEQYATSHYSHKSSRAKRWFEEYPLEAFGKAEWINRLTTFHAMKDLYVKRGLIRAGTDGRVDKASRGFAALRSDAHEMMVNTQFPGGPLNTPEVLRRVPLLARQFMTFGFRSLTAPFRMGPRINEGIRYFKTGHQVPGGHHAWAIADPLRLMGVSAALWEVGSALGVDPTYGLFGSTTTSLFQGAEDPLTKGVRTLPIQLPPAASALNVPLGMLQWFGGGDASLLRENIGRLIPGGIALQRLLGVAPNMPAVLGGGLQKSYADYQHPNSAGHVPVYKWDGSLLRFEKPTSLILSGLGVDLNAHKKGQEIDEYLVKNREEIVQYQQRALMALAGNDIPKAQGVAAEFQKRFQIPLTLSRQQVNAYMKQRTVGRTERILDILPATVRPQYQQLLKQRADNYGITEEALTGAGTASARTAAYGRMPGPELNQATVQEINRLVEEQKRIKSLNEATFAGLKGS